jgi:hypothetical protein
MNWGFLLTAISPSITSSTKSRALSTRFCNAMASLAVTNPCVMQLKITALMA